MYNTHKQIMTLFHFLETILLFSSVNLKNFQMELTNYLVLLHWHNEMQWLGTVFF